MRDQPFDLGRWREWKNDFSLCKSFSWSIFGYFLSLGLIMQSFKNFFQFLKAFNCMVGPLGGGKTIRVFRSGPGIDFLERERNPREIHEKCAQ